MQTWCKSHWIYTKLYISSRCNLSLNNIYVPSWPPAGLAGVIPLLAIFYVDMFKTYMRIWESEVTLKGKMFQSLIFSVNQNYCNTGICLNVPINFQFPSISAQAYNILYVVTAGQLNQMVQGQWPEAHHQCLWSTVFWNLNVAAKKLQSRSHSSLAV